MDKIKGECMLMLAAIIWGSAFIFQKMGMEYIGPMTFTFFRFAIGALCMVPVMLVSDRMKKEKPMTLTYRPLVAGGIVIGISNFAASAFQQLGIVYTTAGKAGFITATDVVMVPLILVFMHRKVDRLTWLGVAAAMIGMYLLCMKDGITSMQKGEILCLGGAAGYAAQIILIDRYAPRVDALKLAFYEFAVTAVLAFIAAVIFEEIAIGPVISCIIPILYTAVLEVCVAFSLQMVGQKYVPAPVATITMALESVFAAVSGALFLNEVMSGREIWGCIILFAALVIAQIPDMIEEKKH